MIHLCRGKCFIKKSFSKHYQTFFVNVKAKNTAAQITPSSKHSDQWWFRAYLMTLGSDDGFAVETENMWR